MSDCWRKANPGLSWGKPCPQCGTYVRVYGDGATEKQAAIERNPRDKALLDEARAPNVSSGVDGDTRATRLAESVERDPQAPATDKPLRYGSSPRHSRFDSGLLTPIPPHGFAAPEAVTPRAWAVSDTDDFGLLRSLPLVIPASLVLWAVIAATWIALI